MDKDELFEIMKEINMAYGNTKFPLTMELVDLWYKALGKRDYEQMSDAAMRFICSSEYAPTIAGLIKEYDAITDEKNAVKRKLNEWWDGVRSTYPKSPDDDLKAAREYYDKLTLNDPDRGSALYTKVCVDVRKSELNHTNLPNIQTYLEGVKAK